MKINLKGNFFTMSIRFMRCTDATKSASTKVLESGQPLYNPDKSELFIGDGQTQAKELKNITPFVASDGAYTALLGTANSSTGDGSIQQRGTIVTGKNAQANGLGSIAFGGFRGDKPTGVPDDEDRITIAKGIQSFAFGAGNYAHGNWSVAGGKDSDAYQQTGIAIGGKCQAGFTEEEFNEIYPNGTDDSGRVYSSSYSNATAFGSENKARAKNSAAFGDGNTVDGKTATSFGQQNTIGKTAPLAFVSGYYNRIGESQGGEGCAVFGSNNNVTGTRVFISGSSNVVQPGTVDALVSGQGLNTYLQNGTYGTSTLKCLIGSYNSYLDAESVFVVGNGTSSARSTAFDITVRGTARCYGVPSVTEDSVELVRGSDLYSTKNELEDKIDTIQNELENKIDQNGDELRGELKIDPATASTYGSVKLGSDEIQTSTAGVYPVQKNQDGQLCVQMLYQRNWYNTLLCAMMREQLENATKEFSSHQDGTTYTFSGDDKWHCVQGFGYLNVGSETIDLGMNPGGFVIYYGSYHQYDVYYCTTKYDDGSFGHKSVTAAPTITSTYNLRFR